MTLKTYIDDINTVDENLRSLYKEQDGRYRLDADFEDVDGLKSALNKQKEKAKSKAEQLNVLSRYQALADEDIDPDDILNLLKQKNETTQAKESDAERQLKKMQAEFDKIQNELTQSQTRYQQAQIDQAIRSNALAAGIKKAAVDDVAQLTKSNFMLIDNEVVVVDADGDATGETISDFFAKTYKAQKPMYFEADAMSGSGAAPSARGATSISSLSDAKSGEDKVNFIKQKYKL